MDNITKGRINFTMTTEQYLRDDATHDVDTDEAGGDGIAMDPEDFDSDDEEGTFTGDEENVAEDDGLGY